MSIYVTGDLHGGNDMWKLSIFFRTEGRTLTRDDYVIICGDFGLAKGAMEPELMKGQELAEPHTYWLRWLDKQPWTTLFVDGNHERFDLLQQLPEEDWRDGKIHRLTLSGAWSDELHFSSIGVELRTIEHLHKNLLYNSESL